MTFKYETFSGKTDYVFDVISMTRVGSHTYEFVQHGREGKLRVVEVRVITLDFRCLCHNPGV